ncbi:MAG TPA: PKD domain-containing protein [Thermoplasmata archaeon]|nr:PKD domain-containing protein [Thermoplasmata archaeon]
MTATPPTMGWNSWNAFGCHGLTETLVRETADAMLNSGLLAAGYDTLTLDDCWSAVSRDVSGNLTNDPAKFPSGMKAIGDYIHSRALKYGIYASIGTATCTGGTAGSLDHEYQDVTQFASWGVDYIKADRCNANGLVMKDIFARWRDAIVASGRPIRLSASDNTPTDEPWAWGPLTAHQWRMSGDISDDWGTMIGILDRNVAHSAATAPGTFNDPDMLEVGNGGMTDTEYRTHFGLWALMSAPLIAGNDVRGMSDATRTILTNPEVIAIDQDPLGFQANLAVDIGSGLQVWYKPLAGSGARAVGLLNRGDTAAIITVKWNTIALGPGNATVRDLWARADRGSFADEYSVSVSAHGMALLRVVGTDPPARNGYLSDQPWTYMANEQGPVERNSSNGGRTLTLDGVPYLRGFGAHAPSAIEFRPDGACQSFTADVGVDDEVGTLGSLLFQVWGDGQKLYEGGVMTGGTPTENVNVSIAGIRSLRLQIVSVDSTADDHADWANPRVTCTSQAPPNQPPQARFTTSRSLAAPWEIVAFDAESSTDPDGTIVSYMWDFGDGFTANGVLVRHAYVHSGRFSVVLTVVDNSQTSTTATSEITVDFPPIAAFSTSLNAAPPGLPILFDASASMDSDGTIVSYAWDFGDGQTGTGVSVTHAYANNGTFTVRLAVVDDLGAVDNVAGSIEIGNRPPTIVSASPQASIVMGLGGAQTLVVIASDLDGDLLSYSWLVDGLSVGGSSSSYVFHGSNVGTHIVRILVSDGRAEASFAWTIEVRARPQPATGHLEPVGEGLFVQVLSASALVALGVILLIQNLRRRRP